MPDFGVPSKKKGRAREEESARAAAAAEAHSRALQATSVQAAPRPAPALCPRDSTQLDGPNMLWPYPAAAHPCGLCCNAAPHLRANLPPAASARVIRVRAGCRCTTWTRSAGRWCRCRQWWTRAASAPPACMAARCWASPSPPPSPPVCCPPRYATIVSRAVSGIAPTMQPRLRPGQQGRTRGVRAGWSGRRRRVSDRGGAAVLLLDRRPAGRGAPAGGAQMACLGSRSHAVCSGLRGDQRAQLTRAPHICFTSIPGLLAPAVLNCSTFFQHASILWVDRCVSS